jgi:hypothetical protein
MLHSFEARDCGTEASVLEKKKDMAANAWRAWQHTLSGCFANQQTVCHVFLHCVTQHKVWF